MRMADPMSLVDSQKLLEWYRGLWSRTVDLVGDFLGSDLFIIDGDSLLLECFSNEKLDFSPGFQVLHATYLVEKFLQKLQQRKCAFEIVFFDQNAPLCIPGDGTDDDNLHVRYLLAREAIIQHLISMSSHGKQRHQFDVHIFESFHSQSFEEHLAQSGAYLLMCHEGGPIDKKQGSGGETNDNDDDVLSEESSDDPQEDTENDTTVGNAFGIHSLEPSSQIGFRLMIRWFVGQGCNIALINNLEFRDTKVMAMVIQGSAEADSTFSIHELPNADTELNQTGETMKAMDSTNGGDQEKQQRASELAPISDLLELAIREHSGLTQSQCLSVVSLAVMLKASPTDRFENISIGATSVILHRVMLQNAKLEDRVIQAPGAVNTAFFDAFLRSCRDVLSSTCWKNTMKKHSLPCDLSDLADGRMFYQVQAMVESLGISGVITSTTLLSFNNLASLVDRLCGTNLCCEATLSGKEQRKEPPSRVDDGSSEFTKVLPFKNTIFDEHLKPVHLEIDESFDAAEEMASRKFLELNHWHHSKPLDQKKAALIPRDWRHQKWDQLYMAEMRRYAESLLGSVGMSQTETIVVERSSDRHKKTANKQASNQKNRSKGPAGPSVREVAAAAIQQKAAEKEEKKRKQWTVSLREFSKIADAMVRSTKIEEYLSAMSKDDRCLLEPEILTYLLDTLIQAVCDEKGCDQTESTLLATQIWSVLARLVKIRQGISADISKYVEKVCRRLGLPLVQPENQVERPLSFKLSGAISKVPEIVAGSDPVEFQLLHGGPFMDRSVDSLPDSRTPEFNPDRWQRDVLDQIDEKGSAFIVAPTSAGKTFISFYAMRQVLKEDDDGVLVYVAPTKALVNQIAAEVMARFSKSYTEKSVSKSVWAIHTRDHRINNPLTCQILITVPHILQIMLLAPSNAKTWTPRLRRIIFDEIHCIGQADDGVVWEQLLLLSPCPIIALSATVGNPEEFNSWLQRAQGTNGHKLKMIQYQHRYSDLRKYVYHPPQAFSFKGFSKPGGLSRLGLDEADGMELMHPVLSLVDRSRGIPDDFSLEPRDCFTLWKAMHEVQTNDFPVDVSLDPFERFSGTIIQKKHVIEWQRPLKDLLGTWMKDRKSPFEALLHRLGRPDTGSATAVGVDKPDRLSTSAETSEILSSTLPLICSLHDQNALPALFFNYDRSKCEDICHQLLTELQEAEVKWKATSPKWKSDMEKWNERQKLEAKKKTPGASKTTKKKGAGNDEPMSRMDQMRESASVENSQSDLFDPEAPVDMFSLSNFKKLQPSEFAVYAEQLKRRDIPKWLIDALERGIGVHHAGMHRKYRQFCEILFRKGFLRVVIATGTLALGINMPCKTVVFCGDSVFLTALNFRQGAGRAGRRGFDLLGNVVFQHIPTAKVQRLISSRLPDLNGHFPITTSLVLRLFILLHGSNQSASAVKSINSILSQPRICLGGPEMKQTVLHFLRFSIEYLRRNHLLDSTGAPLNFAGSISHLYYTESSSFAFHALLISGYFDKLCKDVEQKEKKQKIFRTLMLVMSHLFGRVPLRQSVLESYRAAEKRASSIVVLPRLPKEADKILQAHNKRVLDIYTGYVSTFIDQHVTGHDQCLPFSGVKCGGDKSAAELGLSQQPAPKIASPFYALSGQCDSSWKTVSDLCESVRSDVWLEASVVPYVPVSSESQPLNAYLFDFFKHGNVQQLETANRVRRGDVWFLLNDFSMVLATITTSLENILNPRGANNLDTMMDMLNVGGRGDAREFETDAKFIDEEVAEMGAETSPNRQENATPTVPLKTRPAAGNKSKVAENWEDEVVEKITAKENFKPGRSNQLNPGLEIGGGMDNTSRRALFLVCKAFNELKTEFDTKFKAMWA